MRARGAVARACACPGGPGARLAAGRVVQLAGDDGLYWLPASSVISLIGGVANAWLFMTRS
ncbi:hypothetical protein KDK95_25875 [Actinospica sp. MGRD01-02]|uniref:Uncharacterized protein n=1 Tax=Actinospica acidithermotolerans TaxID=2828514 RepID=A0A941EBI9_9ACTN|nr:hypothetical protein [Actinospica acidithermotolerans]MBR7829760.1 hypothetical protein [Actinospica acidithermotolerans]